MTRTWLGGAHRVRPTLTLVVNGQLRQESAHVWHQPLGAARTNGRRGCANGRFLRAMPANVHRHYRNRITVVIQQYPTIGDLHEFYENDSVAPPVSVAVIHHVRPIAVWPITHDGR